MTENVYYDEENFRELELEDGSTMEAFGVITSDIGWLKNGPRKEDCPEEAVLKGIDTTNLNIAELPKDQGFIFGLSYTSNTGEEHLVYPLRVKEITKEASNLKLRLQEAQSSVEYIITCGTTNWRPKSVEKKEDGSFSVVSTNNIDIHPVADKYLVDYFNESGQMMAKRL